MATDPTHHQALLPEHRAPLAPSGTGDAAPHRRVELAYRQAFFQRFGVQPPIGNPGHAALKTLIANLGVDRTLDVIREQIADAPAWRRSPVSVQRLASHWPRYRA